MSDAANDKLTELFNDLLNNYTGGLSNTSTNKFNPIVDWFAETLEIDSDSIYPTGAGTRPGNLEVRLSQGKQATKHSILALGFLRVPDDKTDTPDKAVEQLTNSATTTLRRWIGRGKSSYDAILVLVYNGTRLIPTKVLWRQRYILDRLQAVFPDISEEYVEAPDSPPDTNYGAVAPTATTKSLMSASTEDILSYVMDDERAPANLIFYGPPGTGKTYLLQSLMSIYQDPAGGEKRFEFVTFHPSFGYESFVEGIRPVQDHTSGDVQYHVVPGAFRRICERAANDPNNRYAIFVDEINRANIATILGELISLIDSDKRLRVNANGDVVHGLKAQLPYSGDEFGVPYNVDILATMNTVDRSITLLDTALRRRFEFHEMLPDPELIPGADDEGNISDADGSLIDLRSLLNAVNRRITILRDREHVIGHGYLLDVTDVDQLRAVFRKKIVPLLQEIFFDDWTQIQRIFQDIRPDTGAARDPQIIRHEHFDVKDVFGPDEILEPRIHYEVADPIETAALRKIYDTGV